MSQFVFLSGEWPQVASAAMRAEALAYPDPRAACFYARRALELAVAWSYKHDPALKLPYQDNLSALIHEPSFKTAAGEAVFTKARLIVTLGNRAVHSARPIPASDAVAAVRELFHVSYWLARTYGRSQRPAPGIRFDPSALPQTTPLPAQTAAQLQSLETQLRDRDEKLATLLADRSGLDSALQRARAEVAEARKAATAQPDTHDYSEAETRDTYIDLLLHEAGWTLDQPRDREFEVTGMPNNQGKGFVDYVLWGDDGKPLAVVEAKRTRRDSRVGQQQARLYANCLEQQFGQRPLIFYTNGYQHWLWDDTRYPPRQVQGFYTQSELALAIQRRDTRLPLAAAEIDTKIVERYYQTRAIRRIGEAFERDNERKSLLVMATGSGKTRTVIALVDVLMRCNWVKRALFLADRVALVNQASGQFKAFLPDAAAVNLVTEKDTEGRVYVSTYPTMMGLIDEREDGRKRFGPGYFDLIIIDEAHRSVYQKYRAIFEYFDALLVGLTATPRDEVSRDTYRLFDLESGVPTDAYSLEEAVRDGFLVPPEAVSVPLKYQREGIRYDQLSDEEKDQWDALDWSEEDDDPPDSVSAEAMNRWLFNKDTVDKVLAHLMTRGLKVAGGDRLGKTILFAKNQKHADFIAERFNANYPHYKGEFARVVTYKTEYAQSLIDDFSKKERAPHIAISVDMLDTGIDVPEVVNLVFFKPVRSKTKFWQMLGRGTRLCPDLFAPGEHKRFFYVFDYCQNLEFFSQDLPSTEGGLGESLGGRLFKRRLEFVAILDAALVAGTDEQPPPYGTPSLKELRQSVSGLLHSEVSAMNLDNFVVRPHRRLVEKFARSESWQSLNTEAIQELASDVAGLPSEIESDPEEARRFDLLLLNLQLALLRKEPEFVRMRDQVRTIASQLEEKSAIPMVREQLQLIHDIQDETWWQDATVSMLEVLRLRLRMLVRLIDKRERKILYTDFEDELGNEAVVELPGVFTDSDLTRFRLKARHFLRAHQDHLAIHKLRMNKALTAADLAELQRMLAESGVGSADELKRAEQEAHGLGLFVRMLVGMDREAAKQSLGEFLEGKALNASQIEFLNLIVNHLTEHGVMEAALLYESPFIDIAPRGPEGLFTATQVDELVAVLARIRATAIAA
ncbi:MAG: DEAD/DEAH box helicase family protein [Xanthomonadales bacterium]|nr:DEAD/DEAH box helicase family protein [Xanthomonadales bacterium]